MLILSCLKIKTNLKAVRKVSYFAEMNTIHPESESEKQKGSDQSLPAGETDLANVFASVIEKLRNQFDETSTKILGKCTE